jgi:hypothetical protein
VTATGSGTMSRVQIGEKMELVGNDGATTWLIGESKESVSYTVPAEYANIRRAVGHAVDLLHCDSGPNHQMKVTFWGRVNQPEYYSVTWKCTREQDAFTCYELSGQTER